MTVIGAAIRTFTIIFIIYWPVVSFQGVQNIWVSSSQWVNTRTQETFARDAVRLAGAEDGTDEEKALAIYYALLRVRGHGGGGREGSKGSEKQNADVWNFCHVYPKGYCDTWARLMCELWYAWNGKWSGSDPVAKKVNTQTIVYTSGMHAISALRYRDSDGVERYHMFDGHLGYFAYTKDGSRIASPEEIDQDITLFTEPAKIPEPFFIRADMPAAIKNPVVSHPEYQENFGNPPDFKFTYNSSIPLSPYKTDFNLRKGESLRRQWYDDDKAPYSQKQSSYTVWSLYSDDLKHEFFNNPDMPKDPRNYKAMKPYFKKGRRGFGNGYHIFKPVLAGGEFSKTAKSADGLASGDSAAGEPALHASETGSEGRMVYEIRNIYAYAESFIEGDYYLKSSGTINIEFSIDSGATWHSAWSSSQVNPGKRSFSADIGKARWDLNQATTFNMASHGSSWKTEFFGYRYLVRIRIKADTRANDVGLASLAFKNTVVVNFGMLPTLLPGDNVITVEGEQLAQGCAVKIEYTWEEDGKLKSHNAAFTSLPASYTINVAETDTLKVKCLYHTISVVDADEVMIRERGWRFGNRHEIFKVFPNPGFGNSRIMINSGFPFPPCLMIYNEKGQCIRHLSSGARRAFWDTRNDLGQPVPSGTYFIRAVEQPGSPATRFTLIR